MSAAYASRYEAVFLCTHPKGPQMSFSAAARYMKKSKDFVRKWVNRYKQEKNVDDLPNREDVRYYRKAGQNDRQAFREASYLYFATGSKNLG